MKNLVFLLLSFFMFGASALEYGWSPNGQFSGGSVFDSSFVNFTQIATPANPAATNNKLYFKSDNNLYMLNSSGVETQVNGGGGGGITGSGTSGQVTVWNGSSSVTGFTGLTADSSGNVTSHSLRAAAPNFFGNLVGTNEGNINGAANPLGLVIGGTGSGNLISMGMSISSYDPAPFSLTVPSYRLRRAHGTEAAPTNLLSGDAAGQLLTDVWDPTNTRWTNGARIRMQATENQAFGAYGTNIILWPIRNTTDGTGGTEINHIFDQNLTLGALSGGVANNLLEGSDTNGDIGSADGGTTYKRFNNAFFGAKVEVPLVSGGKAANGNLAVSSTSNGAKGFVEALDGSAVFVEGDPANSFVPQLASLPPPTFPAIFTADGVNAANMAIVASGGGADVEHYSSFGTFAAPAQLGNGNAAFILGGNEWAGSGPFVNQTPVGQLALRADEVQSPTAMGTRWELRNLLRGTITPEVSTLTVDGLGDVNALIGNLTVQTAGKALVANEASSTPSAPAAGFLSVYPKTDDNLYIENSAGVEEQLQAEQVFTLQTTDGAAHAIATLPLTDTTTYLLQATCSARDQAAVDHAAYKIGGTFFRDGGAATRQGAGDTSILSESSNGAFAVAFAPSTNNVLLNVTGNTAETVNWNCKVEIQSVQ